MHRIPQVNDGWLILSDGHRIAVDSADWKAWLRSPTNTAFRYTCIHGEFTARRQGQEPESAWQAHYQRNKQPFKKSLGRTVDLTKKQLDQIAIQAGPVRQHGTRQHLAEVLVASAVLSGSQAASFPSHVSADASAAPTSTQLVSEVAAAPSTVANETLSLPARAVTAQSVAASIPSVLANTVFQLRTPKKIVGWLWVSAGLAQIALIVSILSYYRDGTSLHLSQTIATEQAREKATAWAIDATTKRQNENAERARATADAIGVKTEQDLATAVAILSSRNIPAPTRVAAHATQTAAVPTQTAAAATQTAAALTKTAAQATIVAAQATLSTTPAAQTLQTPSATNSPSSTASALPTTQVPIRSQASQTRSPTSTARSEPAAPTRALPTSVPSLAPSLTPIPSRSMPSATAVAATEQPAPTPIVHRATATEPAPLVPSSTSTSTETASATTTATPMEPTTSTETATATVASPTDTATVTNTPSDIPTLSATPTFTPTTTVVAPTPTSTVAQQVCSSTQIEVGATRQGDKVVLQLTLYGDEAHYLTSLEMSSIKNADEDRPVMFVERPDGMQLKGWETSDDGKRLLFSFQPKDLSIAPGLVVTATYRHTKPVHTADDSIRLRLVEGKIPCAWSSDFPELNPVEVTPQPVRVAITLPSADDQVFTDYTQAQFGAKSIDQSVVSRMEFQIVDGDGTTLWRWIEYKQQYCVFGGNEQCDAPPKNWWNALPDGRYRMIVNAYTNGGSGATVSRTFMKQAPIVLTATATSSATATSTATDTPTSSATATSTATDTPTSSATATSTATDTPTSSATATSTATDTPTPRVTVGVTSTEIPAMTPSPSSMVTVVEPTSTAEAYPVP